MVKRWQHDFDVGDTLVWGRNTAGQPNHKLVVGAGYGEAFPVCDCDNEQMYLITLCSDVIQGVEVSHQSWNISSFPDGYVVLDEQ